MPGAAAPGSGPAVVHAPAEGRQDPGEPRAGLLLIFTYPFVPNLVLRPLEQRYPPAPDLAAGPTTASGQAGAQAGRWIVVLGGGHTSDPELPVTNLL